MFIIFIIIIFKNVSAQDETKKDTKKLFERPNITLGISIKW